MATLFYAKDFATAGAAGAGKIVFHKGVKPLSTINNNNAIVRPASSPPFLDHMRIFLAIIRAVGLFPMKLPSSSQEYPQISYVAFTYSLCLYAIIMYHIVIIYSHSIPRVVAPNQAFNVVLYIVGNLALIHTFTLIPFSHWCSAKKYTALVIRWSKFLEHFENTYGYHPNLKTKKTVLICIFGTTLLMVVMSIAVRFGVPKRIYILGEVCGLIIVLSYSATFYVIFCNNVQIASDCLCSTFRQDIPPSALAIRNALDMWMQLSAMMETMNSLLNMNISISLILTTTSGALASFGLAIKLLKKNEPDQSWFMSFLFQIADTANIYLLCNSAENATKHLGENVRRRILSCDFSQATFHELQQVDEFLQAIKIENPSLYVIGFVKINRRLFCKIFSVLATYMIVLIQFQMTMPYQTV